MFLDFLCNLFLHKLIGACLCAFAVFKLSDFELLNLSVDATFRHIRLEREANWLPILEKLHLQHEFLLIFI